MIYLSQDQPKKAKQKLFSALLTNYARNYVIDIGTQQDNLRLENWKKVGILKCAKLHAKMSHFAPQQLLQGLRQNACV